MNLTYVKMTVGISGLISGILWLEYNIYLSLSILFITLYFMFQEGN